MIGSAANSVCSLSPFLRGEGAVWRLLHGLCTSISQERAVIEMILGLLHSSGVAQVASMRRQEQILDRHDAFRNALLVQVARQRFERWPVGLDTIGPGVTAEYLVELVDVGGHPRQHVLQRTEIAHT